MSAAITLADAITALVAEKRAVGYKYDAEAAGAGPVRGVLPPASSPGWTRLTRASVEAWIAAARRRGVTPATLQGLAAPVRELARWLGRRGVDGLRPARRGAAQARPLRPAHLHRPGTGGAVRPDRPLPLLLAGPVPAPGHAGAVPHDLRLRPALLRGPAAARRRRRHRRRRAADPRRARAARTGRCPSPSRCATGSPATTPTLAGRTGWDWFFPGTSRPAADARQRRQELPPVPVAGPHLPRRAGATAPAFTICATPWRSTTCGPGSPGGEDVGALLPVLQTYLGHSSHRRHRLLPAADRRVLPGHHRPRPAGHRRRRPARHGRAASMATDFAVCLRRFLTTHLAGLRGCSPNTIASYRDAFKLLIVYFRDEQIHPARASSPSISSTPPRSPGSSTGCAASRHNSVVDPQPAPGRDQLVLPLDANPGPGPDGVLPGHPRDPRQASTTSRASTT